MTILSATEITKAYGTDMILDKVSFHINEGDRVGIVGANGAGKTTLMNILTGRDTAESGSFFIAKGVTVGYLSQKDEFNPEGTVIQQVENIYGKFEEMEKEIHMLSDEIAAIGASDEFRKESGEKGTSDSGYDRLFRRLTVLQDKYNDEGGFSYKSRMRGILSSMAFGEEYYEKEVSTLSGGERTRLALACLLMEHPDILLLDEPTNHLDIGMLKWLEQFLKSYRGTVVLVSHDRYFLDNMCTNIFQIENRKLKMYRGNYTQFIAKRRQQRESELKAYAKQQEEIKRQEEMIRRFKSHGTEHLAKRAASREKRLDALERLEKPQAERSGVKIKFSQDYQSGGDVLFAEGLSKSFATGRGRKEVFGGVDFDIKRGEKICIVGSNGAGKTTLLKIIMGTLEPDSGYLERGHRVEFAYYDQHQELLDGNKTLMEEIHDVYVQYKDSEVRGLLGRFLFAADRVFNRVDTLSGGEKARLALLKLMLSGANVLILDEPTNHLDIDSKEVFEEALQDYPGTVIAVSHDRYFLNKIATKIFELDKCGITEYIGGYDYYEEKRASIESGRDYIKKLSAETDAGTGNGPDRNASSMGSSDENRKAGAMNPAEERILKKKIETERRRIEREKARLEDEIAKLENDIELLKEEMCKPENLSEPLKLVELDKEVKEKEATLETTYDRWMELQG